MKLKSLLIGVILGVFSSTASAALKCTDIQCDVKWKTYMGKIEYASVCYNYKGKSQYKECRRLAADVFKERCDRAKVNSNKIWIDTYCNARKGYKP